MLRINYETLAQFLPVRPERYRSKAREQLDPALQLLTDTFLLSQTLWTESRDGLTQLHLTRGRRLAAPTGPDEPLQSMMALDDPAMNTIEVKELRTLNPPEWNLVTEFYRLWTGDEHSRPTAKELAQARDLIEQYGPAKAKALMLLVVKRLKEQWPEAKTFAAIGKYLPDAVEEFDRSQRHKDRQRAEQAADEHLRTAEARKGHELAALKLVWQALPVADQERIRQTVLSRQPAAITKYPGIVERFCLEELARRQPSLSPDPDE